MGNFSRRRRRCRRNEDEDTVVVFREGRTIYFFDEVDDESVCEAIRFLDKIESENSTKEITIKLNTGGGGCYDGFALYDRIRQSPCNIVMIGSGLIGSMGLIIFLAGDERRLSENARILNHQVSLEEFSGRNSDLKIEQKELDTLNNMYTDIVSERTGQTIKKLVGDVLPGDKYFGSEYAVDNGYADEIIKNTRTYRRKKR